MERQEEINEYELFTKHGKWNETTLDWISGLVQNFKKVTMYIWRSQDHKMAKYYECIKQDEHTSPKCKVSFSLL